MIGPPEHPSFLELDAYALEGRGSAGAHAESCEACRKYVDAVRAPAAVPEWVRSLPKRRSSFARWFPMIGGAGALAAAVLAGLLLSAPMTDPAQALGVSPKAAGPVVVVHVKRGGQVSQWRGGDRLRQGDVLRLEIAPDGFRRVRVAAPSPSGETVLYSGNIEPRGATLLPLGLQIDGASPTEQLRITLEDPASSGGPRAWEKTLNFETENTR